MLFGATYFWLTIIHIWVKVNSHIHVLVKAVFCITNFGYLTWGTRGPSILTHIIRRLLCAHGSLIRWMLVSYVWGSDLP